MGIPPNGWEQYKIEAAKVDALRAQLAENEEQARLLGMGSEREARLMAQLAEAKRTLMCGHHHTLMIVSAETGADLYCELCDALSRARDAETMESDYKKRAEKAEAERDALVAILASLFDWSDTTYSHAVMHVENAVCNLIAELAAEKARADKLEAGFVHACAVIAKLDPAGFEKWKREALEGK